MEQGEVAIRARLKTARAAAKKPESLNEAESWSHSLLANDPGPRHFALNCPSGCERGISGRAIRSQGGRRRRRSSLLLNSPADIFTLIKEIVFEYHAFAGRNLEDIINRQQSLGFLYLPSAREETCILCGVRAFSGRQAPGVKTEAGHRAPALC